MDEDGPRRPVLVGLVAWFTGLVVGGVASPPDPVSQLTVQFGTFVTAIPVAYWLVYVRGYDGPDVALYRWAIPFLVPVRFVVLLAAFVPVALGGAVLAARVGPAGSPGHVVVQTAVTLAGFWAAQWLSFHDGYRRLRSGVGGRTGGA